MSVRFSAGVAEPLAGLGTTANTVTRRRDRGAFRAARLQRFTRRTVSSRWLLEDAREEHGYDDAVRLAARPATCGWAAGEAVGVMRAKAGPARFAGVQTCASVWACACCGSRIREHRCGEVQDAAAWWEAQGGQFLFLTLTVRHYAEDSLERTMDALTGAFTATINGAPWKRFTRRHGIRHWIKAQEVTLGWENGWHAHLHVLLFVDLPGAAEDAADDAAEAWREVEEARGTRACSAKVRKAERRDGEWREAARIAAQGIGRERERELHAWLSDRWADMVVRKGGRRPSRRRGVDIRTVRDGNVVALYVSKLQEGDREKRGWAVGSEMARQDLKKGRLDSLVPLELLDVDGATEDEVERNREHWIEYVGATKGRRSMTWSRGLKDAAGIAELDDDEVAAEEADETEDDRVLIIRAADWRTVRDQPDVLAQILELVEQDRAEEVARLVRFEWPPPLT